MISIPTVGLAEAVIDIGNCSGDDVDKFDPFALTRAPASNVEPPLIRDCLDNIECRIAGDGLVDERNLFILKCERLWIDVDRQEQQTLYHRGDRSFIELPISPKDNRPCFATAGFVPSAGREVTDARHAKASSSVELER